MKQLKKALALLMVFTMLVGLMAACGNSASSGQDADASAAKADSTVPPEQEDTEDSAEGEEAAPAEEGEEAAPAEDEEEAAPAEEGEEAAPAADGDTIKLGVLQVTSDVSYCYFYPGIRIAVEEVNAAGGIDGKMVELVERDSEGNADNVAQRLVELQEEGCVTVIGPAYDYEAPAASQWAEANKYPVIATSNLATSASIESASDWFFTTGPNIWGFMKAVAKEATDKGYSTYYVVANDGGTGADYVNFCDLEMKKLNPDAKMVGYTNVSSAETDYNSIVNSIASLHPDFVVLGMAAFAWTSFVQQADMVDLWADTALYTYLNTETLYASIGDSLPIGNIRGGVVWLRNVDPSLDSPEKQQYLADHLKYGEEKAGFPIDYSDQSATCYLATKAAIEALKLCDGDYSPQNVRDKLETVRFDCVFGNDIGFREFDHALEFTYYMSTTDWIDEEHTNLGGKDVVEYPALDILPTQEEMEAYAAENNIDVTWG